jgi:hypothetical protein
MPMPEEQPPALQLSRSVASHERLLSAREAALWLGVNPRTAQLWARRAQRAGSPDHCRCLLCARLVVAKDPGQTHHGRPAAQA